MTDPLTSMVDTWCERITDADADIQAFRPEPDRRHRLRAEAAAATDRWLATARRPPLWGTLVGVKDVLHADGLVTEAGAPLLPPGELAGPQAAVVTALRTAGALVAGKTVTAQFAGFAPGPTRNPRATDHTPGGSSSGSAAAVAAGFVPLAVGTQTVGSVIRPAGYCGVLGFKPSHGRISVDGVVPNAPSLDTIGFFASDVEHLSRALAVTADGWTPAEPSRRPVIGVPRGPYLAQPSAMARRKFERQLEWLRHNGFHVVDVNAFDDIGVLNTRHRNINAFEFAFEYRDLVASYPDAIAPETLDLVRRGERVPVTEYQAACAAMATDRDDFGAVMTRHGIDLWAAPSATGPAPIGLRGTGDPVMNLPWTHLGTPVLGVPAGAADNGLPLGIQFAAAPGADERLLGWAADLTSTMASLS